MAYFIPDEVAENFKQDRSWSITVTGPPCPKATILHLVKSAPTNYDMRRLVRTYFQEMKVRRENGITPTYFTQTTNLVIHYDFALIYIQE